MATREQADAALKNHGERLMADPDVAYICTRPMRKVDGGEDWVIEIGLIAGDGAGLPRALPLPPEAGPGKVRLRKIRSGPIEAQDG